MKAHTPSNLYHFLDLIRERPELYIGNKTLTTLCDNINGYNLCYTLNSADENLTPHWQEFHDFVALQLNYSESTSGYKNMILESNDFDETESLKVFYQLLDLFKEEKSKLI
ncbi:hypothetical protein [Flavobacterium sp. FlaQc-50]|jgi:hypothetical protein|uniref:hypothetical protein n=1 Tax=unclassified Flavobacterium TaxID=196869 RepID=UPI0037575A31